MLEGMSLTSTVVIDKKKGMYLMVLKLFCIYFNS